MSTSYVNAKCTKNTYQPRSIVSAELSTAPWLFQATLGTLRYAAMMENCNWGRSRCCLQLDRTRCGPWHVLYAYSIYDISIRRLPTANRQPPSAVRRPFAVPMHHVSCIKQSRRRVAGWHASQGGTRFGQPQHIANMYIVVTIRVAASDAQKRGAALK